MAKLKFIKQLFNKSEAKAVAIFERELARKNGRSLKKVEVIRAIDLYKTNRELFNEIGKPWDEDYVVLVIYSKKDEENIRIETGNSIPVVAEKGKVKTGKRNFTVIKYVSRIVKNEYVKIIERFVVIKDEAIQPVIIPLYKLNGVAA